IFTKADKLSGGKAAGNVRHYLTELSKQWEELPPHFVTSNVTGQGRDEILGYIEEINRGLGE
ncbi:MAG: YihA family ribosome biogenesis GTP-binding protein, partial [Bacteroidaceae bacterium]|nr:YihA family ribosome biogenesis GTP-binding protein [Bacteroidaceae bacterium]